MLQGKPSTFNFNKEIDVLKYFPRAPLLSSFKSRWNNIQCLYLHLPAWSTSEHCFNHHLIALSITEHRVRTERVLDGHFQRELLRAGESAIIPAHTPHKVYWDSKIECILLNINSGFLNRTAYESANPECVKIVPKFAGFDPLIQGVGLALKAELEAGGTSSSLFAESAATMLAVHLLRHHSAQKYTIPDYKGRLSRSKLQQAIEYINEHLNKDVSLEAIAAQVGMSRYHFSRLFKQSMYLSVHQYVIQKRVEYAKQLLLHNDLSISQVASLVGFANQSHLSYHFKRSTGITPKMFLRR